tara:strand:+ start:784 stop:1062 length:279 start_codon:yes stop_codon:yes gene_type:complete
MTRKEIDNFVDNLDIKVDILIPDGLDEAFLGVHMEAEGGPRAVYSIEKCIAVLEEDMTNEEATEYFWFNVAGAGGDNFPFYISTPDNESPYG